MDRTTIMLPLELKSRAANHAKKMGISLGEYIRLALKKSLESESSKRETNSDSLYSDNAVFEETTPENLASNHDGYLYGGD